MSSTASAPAAAASELYHPAQASSREARSGKNTFERGTPVCSENVLFMSAHPFNLLIHLAINSDH
jgi:hypothetical protein